VRVNWKALGLTLALLVAPATYLFGRHQENVARDKARRAAREDRAKWDDYLRSRSFPQQGFVIGSPFPPVPVDNAPAFSEVKNGTPTTVLLMRNLLTEPDPNIFFGGAEEYLDRHPDRSLVVISADNPRILAKLPGRVHNNRIRCFSTSTWYVDALKLSPNALLCALDSRGAISGMTVVGDAPKAKDFEALNGA
jgi:hypothetical protein